MASVKIASGALTFALVLLAVACGGNGRSTSSAGSPGVDSGLCPFPLDVTVHTRRQSNQVATTALKFTFVGPSTIELRNTSTGATAHLSSSSLFSLDTTTGNIDFSGHRIWFWASGNRVPFLATDGRGSLEAPDYTLSAPQARARVIDPCALVAASPPSTQPSTTESPWGLPAYALSQIGRAGLTPLVGQLVRHDHVHLDVIVDGKPVTVPAGVGLAEPVDRGSCRPRVGDCATGHFFTAAVANSPLHTHSASGLIHVEPDRRATYTLGEFFDEWGVRLSATCLGGYCAGAGKQLRVFVDGRRVAGDPRRIVLTNRQEIAVVFGGQGDFASVPSTFKGGWPGLGCGGPGETRC
jgi:hypothetical protein